jgi:hypothetical protein
MIFAYQKNIGGVIVFGYSLVKIIREHRKYYIVKYYKRPNYIENGGLILNQLVINQRK